MQWGSPLRRRQQLRRGRTLTKGLKDCRLPCWRASTRAVAIAFLWLWLWLLHRAISYGDSDETFDSSVSTGGILEPLLPLDMAIYNPPSPVPPMAQVRPSLATACDARAPLMLTWQSNQHAHNQDRAFHYPTFLHNQLRNPQDDPSFLVGLFDGHGRDGHLMAEFVVQHFATELVHRLNSKPCCQSDKWIQSKLVETFVHMEQIAIAEAPARDFAYTGGCTASVTLRVGNRLFFANAGDSRTMLASDYVTTGNKDFPHASVVRFTTRLDKADVPEEKERISGLGGRIHFPPPEKRLTSRVILYSEHLKDTVGLAMSRSLGDREWTAVGVIPDPLVDVVRLDDEGGNHPYLIVASDGLWDCRARRPHFFANKIGAILFPDGPCSNNQGTTELVEFVKKITPQQPNVYRDDITVIAFAL